MKTAYKIIIVSLLTAIMALILNRAFYDSRDNDNWIGPYLSGAANLQIFGNFNIDANEVIQFKDLAVEQQYAYKFKKSKNTSHYYHNPIGYAYIIRFATILFPFVGNSESLIILQVLMHILICCLILYRFRAIKQFIVFFSVFYMCNPLIIYFVVINYYYFWQCIPGFILIYVVLSKPKSKWVAFLFMIILLFATLARPTILFLSLLTLILFYRHYSILFSSSILSFATLLFILLNKPIDKNIWHTVYVGIGAYPNSHVPYLSDNLGYQLYEDSTGTELNASLGGNYYEDSVIQKYTQITKNTVFFTFQEDPLLFIRNGVSNTLQCFSYGYVKTNATVLNIVAAVFGLIYLILLWKSKQKFIIVSILLYALMFFPYYPPIQAYLFGAYILLAFSFYNLLSFYRPKMAPPLEIKYPF